MTAEEKRHAVQLAYAWIVPLCFAQATIGYVIIVGGAFAVSWVDEIPRHAVYLFLTPIVCVLVIAGSIMAALHRRYAQEGGLGPRLPTLFGIHFRGAFAWVRWAIFLVFGVGSLFAATTFIVRAHKDFALIVASELPAWASGNRDAGHESLSEALDEEEWVLTGKEIYQWKGFHTSRTWFWYPELGFVKEPDPEKWPRKLSGTPFWQPVIYNILAVAAALSVLGVLISLGKKSNKGTAQTS